MYKFFKDILGIIKKEKEWQEMPRLLPDEALRYHKAGGWAMSREYAEEGRQNRRVYLAAYHLNDQWQICTVTRNLSKNPEVCDIQRCGWEKELKDALTILREFENGKDADPAFIQVKAPGCDSSYMQLANNNGLHFNMKGRVVRIGESAGAKSRVLLTSANLKTIYDQQDQKSLMSLTTWQSVYASIVKAALESAASREFMEEQAFYTSRLPDAIESFKQEMHELVISNGKNRIHTIDQILDGYPVYDLDSNTFSLKSVPKEVLHATRLVSILRIGAEALQADVAAGVIPSVQTREIVAHAAGSAQNFAVKFMKFDKETAAGLGDVIAQGVDPFGPDLPIDTFLKLYQETGIRMEAERKVLLGQLITGVFNHAAVSPPPPPPPSAKGIKPQNPYENGGSPEVGGLWL